MKNNEKVGWRRGRIEGEKGKGKGFDEEKKKKGKLENNVRKRERS